MSKQPVRVPVTAAYKQVATVKATDPRPTIYNAAAADIRIWESKDESAPTDVNSFSVILASGETYTATDGFSGFVYIRTLSGTSTAQVTHYPA